MSHSREEKIERVKQKKKNFQWKRKFFLLQDLRKATTTATLIFISISFHSSQLFMIFFSFFFCWNNFFRFSRTWRGMYVYFIASEISCPHIYLLRNYFATLVTREGRVEKFYFSIFLLFLRDFLMIFNFFLFIFLLFFGQVWQHWIDFLFSFHIAPPRKKKRFFCFFTNRQDHVSIWRTPVVLIEKNYWNRHQRQRVTWDKLRNRFRNSIRKTHLRDEKEKFRC